MDSEFVIFVCGTAAEIILLLMLLKRRVYRTFPAFFVYLCWSLLSDTLFYYVRAHYSAAIFFRISEIQLALDSAMIFALLVELAWNVLRPIRNSLPKYSWVWIAGLVALGGLVLWPIAGLAAPDNLTKEGMILFRLQQTPAILRAICFLALAGFSQLLSIGWRDRELQIATGLGFYSIISLAVTVTHVHQVSGSAQYYWLDVLGEISYLAALVYWVYAFATQTVERREFTPQMQSMLLAVAGASRSTRVELTGSAPEKTSRQNER